MAKYVYPAIFSWNEEDSVYYVSFPDAANWFTDGETVEEAMENATDVLNLMLLHLEETHREADIPTPSRINDIQKTDARDVVTLVAADTAAYAEQLAMQETPIRHAREKLLAERANFFKSNEHGVSTMCDIMEKLIADKVVKIIINQLKIHMPYEQIAQVTETPLDEVIRIAKESNLAY